MNLLFCINQHYLSPFLVTLRSLARFPADYHVYIFHRDLDEKLQQHIQNTFLEMDFHFLTIQKEDLPYFPTTQRYPLEIYYRLYAAHFLPQNLDRILYLDADTLIIHSLETLYETPLGDHYFAGCTHIRRFLRKMNHLRLGNTKDVPYINTGVLLINLAKLREVPVAQDIENFMKRKKHLLLPDQDILSSLYGDHILLLNHFIYNLSDRILNIYNIEHPQQKRDLKWVSEHTVIIHFCGPHKPWQSSYHGRLKYFYDQLMNERKNG